MPPSVIFHISYQFVNKSCMIEDGINEGEYMHEILEITIPIVMVILELIAVIVIVIGTIKSVIIFIQNYFTDKENSIIREMASSMSLALEFILAAEILQTMIVDDRNQLITMSVLLILRIIITFVLHWELESTSKHKTLN